MSINMSVKMSMKHVNRNVNTNVSQNVNQIVSRNVNANVNRNVSREPNFRYTTILQMKMKENVNENVSREPDFRYTTILLKKTKENDRKCTKAYGKKHTHIPQNQRSQKILGSRVSGGIFAKKSSKAKCSLKMCHIQHNGFSRVCVFLVFR